LNVNRGFLKTTKEVGEGYWNVSNELFMGRGTHPPISSSGKN
jgi:hypothetical protein